MLRLTSILALLLLVNSGAAKVRQSVAYLNPGKAYQERLVYRIDGGDTLSLDYFSNSWDWILSIDYHNKVVYSHSGHGLTTAYYSFAQRTDRHTRMVFGPSGEIIYSEYRKLDMHGVFWAFEHGDLVLYGKYMNNNRWWLWYDCTRLPPFDCGYYVCLGRGYMSNREIIYSITESLVLLVYLFSFPTCLVISVKLALRWRRKLFWLGLSIWIASFLLAIPMPDKNWIPRVAVFFSFSALLFYLLVRLFRGNNNRTFNILATITVLLQILITWILYILATTIFSH